MTNECHWSEKGGIEYCMPEWMMTAPLSDKTKQSIAWVTTTCRLYISWQGTWHLAQKEPVRLYNVDI